MLFEISKCDLAGRIGTLETNHGKVQTPAFVPVIHPVKQSIPASKLKEMGFDMVITNAYITMKNYGQEAVERGIHDIIKYDGSVMTDSGYQVLEYGKVDVTPEAMAAFESGIGSDIAIPLDKPTGFGMPDYTKTVYSSKVGQKTQHSKCGNFCKPINFFYFLFSKPTLTHAFWQATYVMC